MKYFLIILSILVLVISFTGCASNTSDSGKNNEPTIASSGSTADSVTITACKSKPSSLENNNTIVLEGVSDQRGEYIEVVVKGEILNFQQVALSWDDSKNKLKEKKVVKTIDKLKNRTLVINTYQHEGIAVEKLKWESKSGKVYEYIIQQDGTGNEGSNIKTFDLT